MSLALGLAVLALVVLAAVGLHSWWWVRRSEPRRADGHDPAAERQEPSLGPLPVGVDEVDASLQRPQEPGSVLAGAAARSLLRVAAVRKVPPLDALIDAIVPMFVDEPVPGEAALAHFPSTRRAGSKPMLIEGLNAHTQEWEHPVPGQMYAEFQAGVQLANRVGALNEIEYSEFVQKVQAFAEGIGAEAEFPDMLEVVARARELDDFASPLDAQITLTLRARNAAWSVPYLQQSAASLGFVPGALPGRLVVPGREEGDPPILVLGFDAQAALADEPTDAPLREVTLSLDVAQTAQELEPFGAWYQAATDLSRLLDAMPLDDRGQALPLSAFESIAKQLADLYAALASRDLAAGSVAARRLFS